MADPFASDEALVGYFEIHSRTDRALFHWTHIRDLYRVAGDPGYPVVLPHREFWVFRWDSPGNAEVIQRARARLNTPVNPST